MGTKSCYPPRMKVLCPACGTTNNLRLKPWARCGRCRQRLPLTVPRNLVYGVRTLWRPLIAIILLVAAATLTPAYKEFRENQKIGTPVTF